LFVAGPLLGELEASRSVGEPFVADCGTEPELGHRHRDGLEAIGLRFISREP
jgi:hypothetical protein